MKFLPPRPYQPRASRRRGSSLIITLAFLVILTILVIGINETTRMNRTSSNLYMDRTGAALLSQNAIEEVIAKLQQATADANRHWLSQPGQIVVGAEQDDGNPSNGDSRKILTGAKRPDATPAPGPTDARIVYLHSGSASRTSYDRDYLNPPNLNVSTFQDPASLLITDRNQAEMVVRWNYIRKDGTIDTREPSDAGGSDGLQLDDTANPIVGRYAYWADDESAKVNYNLAWKRSTSGTAGLLPVGHPSRIALDALDQFSSDSSLANTLHNFLTTDNYKTIANHLFNSPADARQVEDAVASALKANKFEVTHYNHDPDTTFFNEPRIVLTTKVSRASGRPFLDILTGTGADPALNSSLNQAKLNTALFGAGGTATAPVSPGLIYYLSRTDWPMVTGTGSFQSKYFGGNTSQLVQFALNIIDYVRSAEADQKIVEPIRGKINSTGQFLGEWLEVNKSIRGQESTFKGLARGPLITKMGMTVSTNDTRPQMKMFIEVYLPKNYGVDSVNLVDDFRYIFQVNNADGSARLAEADQNTPVTITAGENIAKGTEIVSGTLTGTLTAGNRAVISKTIYFYPLTGSSIGNLRPQPGDKVGLRAGICRHDASTDTSVRPYAILEVVPIGDPFMAGSAKPAGAFYAAPAYTAIGSYSVPGTLPLTALATDDPRVSGIAKDWTEKPLAATDWGQPNAVAAPSSSVTPEQDTDASGLAISQASLYMPAFKEAASSSERAVSSAGELGYIHTGLQVTSSGSAGIPWRTVRLQPSKLTKQDDSVVPDWAFMDLFTAPITVNDKAKPVFAPHDTATGGRVNINAWAGPGPDIDHPFGGKRILPLQAVFQGARNDATNTGSTIPASTANTIAENVYKRTTADNGKLYGYTDGYYSQGEVVEIKGVADQGEASEETVRQIANLVTARGNVFSVYTIAQTLKQTPQGKLVVTAENRQQAMIERYLDASSKKIRFKTVYSRPLSP